MLIVPRFCPSAGGTWQDVVNLTLDQNDNGWAGYTASGIIPQSVLSVTGGTKIRFTLTGASGGSLTNIDKMYVGQAAATWAASNPDFAATPTQVLFSGNPNISLTALQTVVSDEVLIGVPASDGLAYSFYSGSANDYRTNNNIGAPYASGYLLGDSAATVDKIVNSTAGADIVAISKLEVFV